MICEKCGAENADGAKFCNSCRQPLDTSENNNGVEIMKKVKAISKKALIGICIVIATLIVIISIAINGEKTIDLDKYFMIEASGYDGYGTVRTSIDWNAIEEDYGSKISFTDAAKDEYGSFLSITTPMDALKECVNIKLDKYNGVSNGDSVVYKWEIDNAVAKYVKCKVKFKDGTYTVSGLAEVGTFDAFASVEVQFSGISPSGKVDINYNGSELNKYDFKCDKTSGLKNGDTIEIYISDMDMEYYAKYLGKIPKETSKTYTVNGLKEYILSNAAITDSFRSELKSEAEDSIYAYTASSYNKTMSLSNLEYAGYLFDSIKDGDSWYISTYNDLYIIYKGDVSSSEGNFNTTKVYYPVRFSNILKDEDGNLSYGANNGIAGSFYFDGRWYSTKGYTNPLICYTKIVGSNGSNYTSACGDGFELYSEYESISKLEDISETYKETVRSDAKDKVEGYIASNYSSESAAENLSFVGEYFLTAKTQGNDALTNNKYIVVYSASVSNSKGRFETTTVYFPVEYDGVVKLSSDEYMIAATGGILGNSTLSNNWYSTRGYIDGTEMYKAIVSINRDKYRYEISDELKEFGE